MQELEKLLRLALLEAASMNEQDARAFVLMLMLAIEDWAFEAEVRPSPEIRNIWRAL